MSRVSDFAAKISVNCRRQSQTCSKPGFKQVQNWYVLRRLHWLPMRQPVNLLLLTMRIS